MLSDFCSFGAWSQPILQWLSDLHLSAPGFYRPKPSGFPTLSFGLLPEQPIFLHTPLVHPRAGGPRTVSTEGPRTSSSRPASASSHQLKGSIFPWRGNSPTPKQAKPRHTSPSPSRDGMGYSFTTTILKFAFKFISSFLI